MPRKWSEEQLRILVPRARNRTDLLRRLGLCTTGGNAGTVQRWIDRLGLDTSHFEGPADVAQRTIVARNKKIPLKEVLVTNSTYSRYHLKRRLLGEGVLKEVCELCGQKPEWRGKPMSLILDHINGVRNDNRAENLRLVCPNCNATLPTHCGRKPVPKKIDEHSGVDDVGKVAGL